MKKNKRKPLDKSKRNYLLNDKLSSQQKKELQKHTKDMISDASKMVKDYQKNPSSESGSVIQVNENSPFLEVKYKGKSWKKVIHGSPKDAIDFIKSKKVIEPQVDTEIPTDWGQVLQKIRKKEEINKFNKKAEDNFNFKNNKKK